MSLLYLILAALAAKFYSLVANNKNAHNGKPQLKNMATEQKQKPFEPIATDQAPAAIGTYSQAVMTKANQTFYLSGQIPLDPATMEMVSNDFADQARQVFENLQAVCAAAGGSLDQCVKLTIYLTDLNNFATVNETMAQYVSEPYPARAAIEVSALPKGAQIEIDAIMVSGG